MLMGQNENTHWKPDVNKYSTNMSVIAVVSLGEVEQRDAMIELGAFYSSDNELNGELRGSKKMVHIQTQNGIIDRYMAHITIYGNAGDVITFRLYSHELGEELNYITDQSITFVVDGTIGTNENPYVIDFSKNVVSNSDLDELNEKDNAVINEDVIVVEGKNIAVNDLTINSGKSLTIQEGGILTVNGTLSNAVVEALVIEEGAQLIHYNEGVAATFRNEIVIPQGTWGEEDKTGWQFISSPMENISTNYFIPTSGDYDLYMYDGTQENQWRNFKQMGSTLYDFSTTPFVDGGWTAIDADGDGMNWSYNARGKYVYSISYDNNSGVDIFAENYFVSPQVKINNGTKLNFKVRCSSNDFYPETIKVLLSESSNSNVTDFNIELGNYTINNTSYQTTTIDLSEYTGKNVHVAFYHYISKENLGSEQLIIDDVEFVNENNFEKGRAYLASYQNAEQVAEFKGNLNYINNEEAFQMTFKYYPSNKWANFNLVGNPFSFDINWETDVQLSGLYDGYALLNSKTGSYEYLETGTIKAGEGFMVKTIEGANNSITMHKNINPVKRSETNSINIIASGKDGSDNVIVRYDENEEADGFVKLENFNDKIANIYVKSNDNNYAIFNCNEETTELSLYFDAKEMGTYTLTFDIDGDYENLYLSDKMTGEKVNLLIENEYFFIANSNDSNDRFILSFANSQQPIANGNFAYVSGEELIINAEGSIQIIDMMGRVVYSNDVTNDNNRIDVSDFDKAAYIIRVINENGINVQKIVL